MGWVQDLEIGIGKWEEWGVNGRIEKNWSLDSNYIQETGLSMLVGLGADGD